MAGHADDQAPALASAGAAGVRTLTELARLLRQLRRREARRRGESALTYRELAAKTGWSRGIIGEYLAGKVLPPTDRFDVLIGLLGASAAEQGMLATARDRVEEDRRGATVTDGRPHVPQELPADVHGFTGRAAQLVELDALLDEGGRTSAVVVSAVSGTAGVGKTALAVHWAHRVADRFPDGQLYIDLRGYDLDEPLPPAVALAALLRSLGVSGADVPSDVAERAVRYRTLLAGRRMLIVLDNAQAADHVRPLLPGTSSCLVVVTSRDDLAGLVARDGARRLNLDVLPSADAIALLRKLIGVRVDAEPAAAATLAEHCARLPLALRVAAELAVTRGAATLADLLADLRDDECRLDALDASGDPRAAVRAVFSWSYRHLSRDAARAFALIGLHPGAEVNPHAVAALAGTDLGCARRLVNELTRAHLAQQGRPGRFGMHDLLRAYAAERASDLDGALSQTARTRLFDHYLHTAAAAMDTLFPHERDDRPRLRVPATTPPVGEPSTAAAWLEEERQNLVAMCVYAAANGWPRHSIDLSRTLWRYLEVRGHYQDALAVHTNAVHATLADGRGRAGVLTNLGLAQVRLGRSSEALGHLEEALALSREKGDRGDEARALGSLGAVYAGLGRYVDSLDHLQEALAIYRAIGNRHGEGGLLGNLGLLYDRLGRYAEAVEYQREAVAVLRETGDRRLEGYALGNLGAVYSYLGRYPEALDHLDQALTHCRESNDRAGVGYTMGDLGSVYRRSRCYPEALDHLGQALVISREIGNRSMETDTLNALGETQRALRRPEAALANHEAALAIASQTGDRRQQARALNGIGHTLHDLGRTTQARGHWSQALAIYTDLDVPEAHQVRSQIGARSVLT